MSAAALLITPSISSAIVTSAGVARDRRDLLITQAAGVVTVTDRLDFDDASATLKELKTFSKEILASHAEAKAPVLDIGRKIDALKKELVAQVDAESDRIGTILGAFEFEERRKAEDAQRAADEKLASIAREAEKKATAVRMAAPDALSADRASDAVIEKAAEQIVQVRQQAANAVVPKTAGSMLRETVEFEITDIKQVYAAFPEMVKLEPNGRVIRALLDANPNLKVPGMTHKRVPKFSVS